MENLIILDETVLEICEISGIVILFLAGLTITPKEFLRGGRRHSSLELGRVSDLGYFKS